ncbi:wsv047 [White spot syndrome virus]|uniref:Wsv047 n=3 Tax=White spot syndrome virus TaxID=342409 RepID=Q8VBC0_WSSVS|nr:wsv047 [Shrimp white spot syndrome virus]AFX59424.1 wsv047 [White spot syndrome virus]AAL33051.1 wsv047 [Shrimp white spot syndrome virus]AAL88972.1 WSSV104 [Shrimp white spot syndrome virus]AWQ60236.1 wsv047 [Shrimp white spot syndrome virus]AWQ60655.1 wsv047 [Shrimp white spot syndrome virus]
MNMKKEVAYQILTRKISMRMVTMKKRAMTIELERRRKWKKMKRMKKKNMTMKKMKKRQKLVVLMVLLIVKTMQSFSPMDKIQKGRKMVKKQTLKSGHGGRGSALLTLYPLWKNTLEIVRA